jgi:hypothetical protein
MPNPVDFLREVGDAIPKAAELMYPSAVLCAAGVHHLRERDPFATMLLQQGEESIAL